MPDRGELEARAQLPGHSGVVHAALWRAGGVAATLDDAHLRSWQLGDGRAEVGSPLRRFGFEGVQMCGYASDSMSFDVISLHAVPVLVSASVHLWGMVHDSAR